MSKAMREVMNCGNLCLILPKVAHAYTVRVVTELHRNSSDPNYITDKVIADGAKLGGKIKIT